MRIERERERNKGARAKKTHLFRFVHPTPLFFHSPRPAPSASRALSLFFPSQVYNYWEPLHFLLHASGFQTWEYSAAFALRPWAYLGLHAPAAWAGEAAGLGGGAGVRAALAAATAGAEAALFAALRDVAGQATALAFLALALPAPGLYAAGPALLPSSFAMVAHAACTAAALRLVGGPVAGRRGAAFRAIVAAAVGLLWGWPVAAPAFLPAAVAVLALAPSTAAAAGVAVAATVGLLALLILADRLAYGRWTVSLLNFLRYNVAGGGESALYGTEPPAFYAKALLLACGAAVPLAAASPALAWLAGARGGRARSPETPPPAGAKAILLAAAAPVALWVAAITALPHKEDRFLYPAFPALLAAAGLGLACLPAAVRAVVGVPHVAGKAGKAGRLAATALVIVVATVAAALGLARSAALATFYSAPRTVWAALPPNPGPAFTPAKPAMVCMGGEWHRYPGAFSLPPGARDLYRPAFVRSSFAGLLPVPFDAAAGGASAAPPTLNDRNRHEPANELENASSCAFFVGIAPENGGDAPDTGREWEVLKSARFADVGGARAAGLGRWLYVPGVPGLDGRGNGWVRYVLLRRRTQVGTMFV